MRDQLADVEEEIAAEGLESEAFDEHIAEIRDALDQRDMAGVAVAEESLAELEARLRQAREARAEQELIADAAGGEQATDGEEGDQIADYMRELEEEFGAQDGDEIAADDDELAMTDEAVEGMEDETAGETGEPAVEEAGDDAQAGTAEATEETGAQEEAAPPMTVTRTSDGMSTWTWLLIGLLVLVVIAVAALVWARRRSVADETGEPSLAAGGAVDSARAAVTRDPGDLAAHLALLKLLADQGREQEFTDAFDQMYQEVDDESAPEWQDALSLASAHVPEHPLLTPHEMSADEEFDRRADEMFGMLDVDEPESASAPGQEPEAQRESRREDNTFDLGGEIEEDERPRDAGGADVEDTEESDREESFEADMDLAVLSERLDDPSREPGRDKSLEGSHEDADFDEFEELDEYAAGDAEAESDEDSEKPVDLEKDRSPGLDLDFAPSREQEADEVFGEAGARETEDLDLDLSSEVEDLDSPASKDSLDFDLDETAESERESIEPEELEPQAPQPEETAEALEESESEEISEPGDFEAGEDSAPAAAGGSLSDEDADVKLDLARAYISVDLADSARTVLEEVASDGSEEKRAEAEKLLDELD